MMSNYITFTIAASEYFKKILAKENALGVRLSIKKTGCSGYSYHPSIVNKINSTDIPLELENGVKIFIDSTWLEILNGLVVDYREEDKSGLKQKKLVFTNTKESGRCGCGESFHLDSESKHV